MRALIVDDEPLSLELMEGILNKFDNLELIGRAVNGREALQAIRVQQPDLVFLDVHMPGMSGFDVIRELQADSMPLVIFATAFDRYALEAFEVHAVDYLLKPFDPERVRMAVDRAQERLTRNGAIDRKAPLIGAIESMSDRACPEPPGNGQQLNKLAIRDRGMVELVAFDSIDWVDAAGDYMCIHAEGRTHVLRSTMKALEAMLPEGAFARVHRSTLVNLNRIQTIEPLPKGEFRLYLNDGVQVKVSRSHRQAILPLL